MLLVIGIVAVLLLLPLLAVALGLVLFMTRPAPSSAEATVSQIDEASRGFAYFEEDEIEGGLPPLLGKEEFSLGDYLRYLHIGTATSFAEEQFRKAAEGSEVDWLLRVVDIEQVEGAIVGRLASEYRISNGRSTTGGSTIHLQVEFAPGQEAALATLSQGQWVQVKGRLVFGEKGSDRIREARL